MRGTLSRGQASASRAARASCTAAAATRGSVIERAYRDIRAAQFHPYDPERSLLLAGRLALGLPVDAL